MSFQDWINQDSGAPDRDRPATGSRDDAESAEEAPGWAFANAARARAQAERQSNRDRRRRTWRARAVLARRSMSRKEPDAGP